MQQIIAACCQFAHNIVTQAAEQDSAQSCFYLLLCSIEHAISAAELTG
jgi:hypothetical protein